jgi:hypothetical protein
MAQAADGAHHSPPWFTGPGEGDFLILFVVALVFGALYGIVYLYAAFDRWAEHKAAGTPLAKTIPTLLLIALLYEIFPLDHFSVLLPLAAILIALLADWSRFHLNAGAGAATAKAKAPPPTSDAEGDHA